MLYITDISQSDHSELLQCLIPDAIFLPIKDIFKRKYQTSDIIVCPWQIQRDLQIDHQFEQLANTCWIVASAGNTNQNINLFSPTAVHNVITVGALNKKLEKASHSNFSTAKQLEWVVATNIEINGNLYSGTSAAAVIYSRILQNCIENDNLINLKYQVDQFNLAQKI